MGRSALIVTGMTGMLALGAGVRPLSAQTCNGSTVQVTSTADSDGGTCGPQCTLREAINAANASADCTRITFDFSPAPGGEIVVNSPLPVITTPVHLLGWTHPGSTRIGPEGEEPDFRVTIRGANNIAGSALRFVDAGGGLVEGLAIGNFTSGAAIEIVASTNADQNITIRENALGIWKATGPIAPASRCRCAGNIIIGTAGPVIHVTTSPTGIQGQARILGNHLFYWSFFNTPFAVDLGPEGRTPNDPGDGDAGPNDLQNFPEVRFEAIRVEPLGDGEPPCGPTSGSEPFETCDAVRITATLRDAPAGTYTAELHAGFLGDVAIDDGDPLRYRVMGARTVTGSGDIVFEIPRETSGSAQTIIDYLQGDFQGDPGVYVSVSQGTVSTFAGPTSEWSEGGTAGGPGPGAAAADLHALFRGRRDRRFLQHDVLPLELRHDRGNGHALVRYGRRTDGDTHGRRARRRQARHDPVPVRCGGRRRTSRGRRFRNRHSTHWRAGSTRAGFGVDRVQRGSGVSVDRPSR